MALAVNILRWTLGGVGVALGGYLIILQFCVPLWQLWARLTARLPWNYSFVPLLGPLLFQGGAWLLPAHGLRAYSWLGWVLDPGTWLLLLSVPFLAGEYRKSRAGGAKR